MIGKVLPLCLSNILEKKNALLFLQPALRFRHYPFPAQLQDHLTTLPTTMDFRPQILLVFFLPN